MRGTWCTPELEKAVERGYKILKIHEGWNFPENQRKEGLFAPYVNTWLKYKTEASGWPDHCDTQKERSICQRFRSTRGNQVGTYLEEFWEKTTCKAYAHQVSVANYYYVDGNKRKNSHLSFLLYLSSFWGKFGENEHSAQTIAIQDENVWQTIIQDESLMIKDVRIINQDILEVNVMKHEEACSSRSWENKHIFRLFHNRFG